MIRIAGRASVLLFVAGLASACVQPAFLGAPDMADRKRQAEDLTRQGDFAEALVQLKVLETLSPHDPEIVKMRRSVEAKTKRLAKSHYQKGEAAAKRNKREAWQEYVTALTYDPRHEGALRRLRQLELQRIRGNGPRIDGFKAPKKVATPEKPAQTPARVTAPIRSTRDFPKPVARPKPPAAQPPTVKSAPDNSDEAGDAAQQQSLDPAIALAKAGTYLNLIKYAESYLSRHPGDDKAMDLLALSHERVGLAFYHDGSLRKSLSHLEFAVDHTGDFAGSSGEALADVRARLANEAFEQGVRVFRQDISQAISYWEETLTYDPGHAKARLFLAKSYRIRNTLNEIADP